jgi:hemoglobin
VQRDRDHRDDRDQEDPVDAEPQPRDLDLPAHLPRVAVFWNMVIFGGPADGTMMAKHFAHHRTKPILPAHFDRWLEHFTATVDDLYVGDNAEEVKQRARTIAAVMRVKIDRP